MTKGTQLEIGKGEPTSLVQYAIEKGTPVEVLERLVALQERVTEREARSAFFDAMSKFQAACPAIKKTGVARVKTKSGVNYQYKYSELNEIARVARPILSPLGLSYTWDSTLDAGKLNCSCTLRHIDGHSETATFSCPTDTKADMSGAQATGAALTYARRQSLIQVLGLTTTDEDIDGAGEGGGGGAITDEQAADLQALVAEVFGDDESRRLRFLKWLHESTGAETIADVPAIHYASVVATLERKRRG